VARLRNRILKADFWSDGELLRWPREKRFTYSGLYAMAEDSGCVEDDTFTWKCLLWTSPFDADITVEMLDQWRDEMCEAGKLVPYSDHGDQLLFIRAFHEHEHPRNPQSPNLPLPPWVRWVPGNREEKTRGHYEVDDVAEKRAEKKKPAAKAGTDVVKSNGKDDGSFEIFWAFYPRHEGRKTAEVAWRNISKANHELAIGVAQVMGDLFRYGQKEKKYIPMPTTFLHQERWEDWREGVPAGWQDESQDRAAQQASTLEAALAATYTEEGS